jgi:hypothetical protein
MEAYGLPYYPRVAPAIEKMYSEEVSYVLDYRLSLRNLTGKIFRIGSGLI